VAELGLIVRSFALGWGYEMNCKSFPVLRDVSVVDVIMGFLLVIV